jgi:hypothetical protein
VKKFSQSVLISLRLPFNSRTTVAGASLIFALVTLLLGADSCRAEIYDIDQAVGAGSVTGFIETDGTVGALSSANISDWNLVLTLGGVTVQDKGPLSGSNDTDAFYGAGDLFGSPTELTFETGVAAGYFAIGGNLCYSDNVTDNAEGCLDGIGVTLAPNGYLSPYATLDYPRVAAEVVGVAAPEPTSFILLLLVTPLLAVTGMARRRVARD